MNSPGRYLNWSIFTISVANLVLIAVMVVIFGLALLLPFPGRTHVTEPAPEPGPAAPADAGDDADARMWTSRVRRRALRLLPPGKLLPDRQPAYVTSWIYVFGVASLAALATVIVSGCVLALGGPDWWHTNPVGHFVNSMHLWSVALARTGAIDGDLSGAQPFYGTDFTRPLLFLEDGQYYVSQATAMHLTGDQWGVMNETGSYPGQPWLWLYQLWYHVPGWQNSVNVDLIAIYMTGLGTLLLLLVPFLPGLRDIPRWIPLHRLIWRTPPAAPVEAAGHPPVAKEPTG